MSSETSRRFSILRSILFWAASMALAYTVFTSVRDFTVCWRVTSLPGTPPGSCSGGSSNTVEGPVFVAEETPLPSTPTLEPDVVDTIEYPTWDGASRINILFVGFRGGEPTEGDCPYCTDTLILMTVDPVTKTAGMLSIPRDMWVNIPGFGFSRINTAWTLGRGSKLPGGGSELTMKTVSQFIGVPIDYYVQVDFDTFIDIIDLLGGVDVYNDETLFLDPMARGVEYPKVKLTCCGVRHMNGRVALAYARCRHIEQGCSDGDIGRSRRQQKVIFAMRDKIFSAENFPTLLAQAPELYNTFSDGIHTNMSLDDAIRLAVLVRDIPEEDIKHAVIDKNMIVLDMVKLNGQNASIIRPIYDRIRIVRDEIFTSGGPVGPLAEGDITTLMLADQPRIRVLNGTSTPQLENRTGDYLEELGIPAAEFGSTKAQSRTTIILYSPKLYALKFLMDAFAITSNTQILIKPDPTQTVDIEIRLGSDWIKNLPAGY